MLETIREHTKSESLRPCYGLVARGAISQNARKVGDFTDPATIFLSFKFYGEIAHASMLQPRHTEREIPSVQRTTRSPARPVPLATSEEVRGTPLETRKRRATSGPRRVLRGVGLRQQASYRLRHSNTQLIKGTGLRKQVRIRCESVQDSEHDFLS